MQVLHLVTRCTYITLDDEGIFFALLNQGGWHNIDLPRYCNLGLGHAFGI